MDIKKLIRADSDTFWRWVKANPICYGERTVCIMSDGNKTKRVAKGKNKKTV